MPGSMTMPDLVADLKASLQDSAAVFSAAGDADFNRQLTTAAAAFNHARPRTLVGSVTLVADQSEYAAPADFYLPKSPLWGINPKKMPQPWETNYPGPLPRLKHVESAGVRVISLDPPPNAAQINTLGSTYKFYYIAAHSIHATNAAQTTIVPGDRDLLLLRAQAESMREMALRNIKKPVALRDGLGMTTRNGTPAALYDALLKEFDERVRCEA